MGFGCCPVLPFEEYLLYFLPPYGSIVVIVKYYEFLTLIWGILFTSHILITLFCIACVVYSTQICDKKTNDCDNFLNIGLQLSVYIGYVAGWLLICPFKDKLFKAQCEPLAINFASLNNPDEEESGAATYRPKVVQFPRKV